MRQFLLAVICVMVSLPANAGDEVYNRVMKSGRLRCGYGVEKPYTYKDLETGELKGIFHDYVNKMAENLSLEVEWAEEMGWGEFPAALESGRVDAFCTIAWRTAGRARLVDYVTPITYQPVLAITKAGNDRFDGNPETINDESVVIVGVEGNAELLIASTLFPKARQSELPQIRGFSGVLMDLEGGKGDVALVAGGIFAQYDEQNPGKLKAVDIPPVQMNSESITVRAGEHTLRRMFDAATVQLLESGTIEKIINDYGLSKETYYVAKPGYKKRM